MKSNCINKLVPNFVWDKLYLIYYIIVSELAVQNNTNYYGLIQKKYEIFHEISKLDRKHSNNNSQLC